MRIRPKPLSRKTFIIGLVLVSVLGTSTYALSPLFTHIFPATPNGVTPVVTTACSGATLAIANTNAFFTGTSLVILYVCPNSQAAVTAIPGTVSPTTTIPTITGTTLTLGLVVHSMSTSCVGTLFAITSGTPVTFGSQMGNVPPGDYDYCLSVSSYPSGGIPTFSITWQQ